MAQGDGDGTTRRDSAWDRRATTGVALRRAAPGRAVRADPAAHRRGAGVAAAGVTGAQCRAGSQRSLHQLRRHLAELGHVRAGAGESQPLHPRAIRYSDGSKRDWSFPRMDQLDFVTRYRLERFRKYEEYAHLDAYAAIWPDLARWVARQNVGNPANPPVLVTLIRSWWEVPPPPANGDISHDPPHAWSSYQFFQQPISRSDLQ